METQKCTINVDIPFRRISVRAPAAVSAQRALLEEAIRQHSASKRINNSHIVDKKTKSTKLPSPSTIENVFFHAEMTPMSADGIIHLNEPSNIKKEENDVIISPSCHLKMVCADLNYNSPTTTQQQEYLIPNHNDCSTPVTEEAKQTSMSQLLLTLTTQSQVIEAEQESLLNDLVMMQEALDEKSKRIDDLEALLHTFRQEQRIENQYKSLVIDTDGTIQTNNKLIQSGKLSIDPRTTEKEKNASDGTVSKWSGQLTENSNHCCEDEEMWTKEINSFVQSIRFKVLMDLAFESKTETSKNESKCCCCAVEIGSKCMVAISIQEIGNKKHEDLIQLLELEQNDIKELKSKMNYLEIENTELRQRAEEAEGDTDALLLDFHELGLEKAELETEVAELKTENALLKEQLEVMNDETFSSQFQKANDTSEETHTERETKFNFNETLNNNEVSTEIGSSSLSQNLHYLPSQIRNSDFAADPLPTSASPAVAPISLPMFTTRHSKQQLQRLESLVLSSFSHPSQHQDEVTDLTSKALFHSIPHLGESSTAPAIGNSSYATQVDIESLISLYKDELVAAHAERERLRQELEIAEAKIVSASHSKPQHPPVASLEKSLAETRRIVTLLTDALTSAEAEIETLKAVRRGNPTSPTITGFS